MRRVDRDEPNEELLRVAEVALDRNGRRVSIARQEVTLTRSEFDLLAILMAQPGRVFSRLDLVEQLPNIMRSLRLKLIFTYLVVSVAGTLLTALIVRSSNERAFAELLREQEQAEFISGTLAYYASNGSWQGVAQAMDRQNSPTIPGQPPSRFALTDENGRIIIPNGQFTPDSTVPQAALADGLPLEADGIRVGTVLTDN